MTAPSRALDLAPEARRDIAAILAASEADFGPVARRRYRLLIEAAFADLQADPSRAGVRPAPDTVPDLHLYAGIRVVSAFYGVLSYTVSGRTVLVDFRPEFGAVDHQRAFARQNRGLIDPVRILRPQPRLLEQRDSWTLLERLAAVTIEGSPLKAETENLRDLAAQQLSALRNRVLYDSVYWAYLPDFRDPRQANTISSIAARANDPENLSPIGRGVEIIDGYVQKHFLPFAAQIGFDRVAVGL